MSTLVFKTPEDAPHDTEISGVGVLRAGGANSIPIDRASMSVVELQERDEEGRVVPGEGGGGKPLTGKKLEEAAKAFASSRGLVVESMTDKKLAAEGEDGADLIADLPSAIDVGRAAYAQTYGEAAPPIAEAAGEKPAAADDEGGKS